MSDTIYLQHFSGENDDARFENAMAYLRTHPNTTLIVEPRVYEITTPLARRTMEDVLSGVYGSNPEPTMFSPSFAYSRGLSLEGQSGTTILAHGATLMVDGFMEPLSITNCKNVTIRGLTIDHKRKPYSMGKIESVHWRSRAEGTGSFIVRFRAEYPTNESTPMPRYMLYDPYASRCVHYGEWTLTNRKYLGDNCWKFIFKGVSWALKGLELYVWHTFHFRPAILIEGAEDVTLDDVTIHSQPGMGVVAHRSANIHIDRMRVVPSAGSHMSTNTDAVHITSCRGLVRIENSVFDGQGDDSLNIHTYYHSIEGTDGCRCTTVLRAPTGTHSQTADYPEIGDVLELTDMRSLRCIDTYRVISCTRADDPWRSALVLDKPLPECTEGLALANASQLPRLEYIGNYCRSHLARSVLVKIKNARVEGNTIMNVTGTGVYVAAEAWWYEGLCTTEDIVIRRNRIADCGRDPQGARQRDCGGICVTIDAQDPSFATHKSVVIEDNIIDCPDAPHGIYVSNTENLTLLRNQVIAADEPIVIEHLPI